MGGSSNNLFGVKAGSACQGDTTSTTTTEYSGADPAHMAQTFRSYQSVQQSVHVSVSLLQGQRRYFTLSQMIHHLGLQILCAVACIALLDQVLGFNPLPITHCTTELQNPNGTLLRGPSP